jgi:hypothetical protein
MTDSFSSAIFVSGRRPGPALARANRPYLSIVPAALRFPIITLAKETLPKGKSGALLVEMMAKQWLEQKELFYQLAQKNGFFPVKLANKDEPRQIVALTVDGSVLGVREASPEGPRPVFYRRTDHVASEINFSGNLFQTMRPGEKAVLENPDQEADQEKRMLVTAPVTGIVLGWKENGDNEFGNLFEQMARNLRSLRNTTL